MLKTLITCLSLAACASAYTNCPSGEVSETATYVSFQHLSASKDLHLLSQQEQGQGCTTSRCSSTANQRMLLFGNNYTCVCNAGYHLTMEGGCRKCPGDRVCIGSDLGHFQCPPHSRVASPLPRSLIFLPNFPYCIPDTGYELVANTLPQYTHRIFTRDGSTFLYSTKTAEKPCPLFQVKTTDGTCQCPVGFYAGLAQDECRQCTAGAFCPQGSDAPQPCPDSFTSLPQSAVDADCSIIKCSPGQYLDSSDGRNTCKTCGVGFFCHDNRKHSCPAFSTTLFTGSPASAFCLCQDGHVWAQAENMPAKFVCVMQGQTFLEESSAHSLLTSVPEFADERAWTSPDSTQHVLGAIVRFNNRLSQLSILVVQADTSTRAETCDMLSLSFSEDSMYNCSLDDFNGRTTTDLNTVLHVSVVCYDIDDPSSRGELLPVAVLISPSAITCSSLTPGGSDTFEQGATTHTFRIQQAMAFVQVTVEPPPALTSVQTNISYLNQEVLKRIRESIPEANMTFLGNEIGNYATTPDTPTMFRLSCHGMRGSSHSPPAASPSPFLPRVTAMATGLQACLSTPTDADTDFVDITDTTTNLVLRRNRTTVVRWPGDKEFTLASNPDVRQTLYGISKRFNACYDREIGAHLQEADSKLTQISKLSGQKIMMQYYPDQDFLDMYNLPITDIAKNDNLWQEVQTDIRKNRGFATMTVFFSLQNTNTSVGMPVTFILLERQAEKRADLLRSFLTSRGMTLLRDCLRVENETQRFGETTLVIGAAANNVSVNKSSHWKDVKVSLRDAEPNPTQVQCYDIETCQSVPMAKHAQGHYAPPPHEMSPAAWSLASGAKRALVLKTLGSRQEWHMVTFRPAYCPPNSSPKQPPTACACNKGFKIISKTGGVSCAPCASGEICQPHKVPVMCNITAVNPAEARCACPIGYRYNNTGVCDECDEYTLCEEGVALFCGDKMKLSEDRDHLCVCLQGYYLDNSTGTCFACPRGFYCDRNRAQACGHGMTTEHTHAAHSSDCTCDMGFYDATGENKCRECEQGTYKNKLGSAACEQCTANKTTVHSAATTPEACVCQNGYLAHDTDSALCSKCHNRWSACENQQQDRCDANERPDTEQTRCVCEYGYFRDHGQICRSCPRGYYCEQERIESCPAGMTSRQGTHRALDCYCENHNHAEYVHESKRMCACHPGFFADGKDCLQCPANSIRLLASGAGAQGIEQCRCRPGFFRAASHLCLKCRKGYWCPGNHSSEAELPCPKNTFSIFAGLHSARGCIPCNASAPTQRSNAPPYAFSPIFCHDRYMPLSLEYEDSVAQNTLPPASFHDQDKKVIFNQRVGNCINLEEEARTKIGSGLGLKPVDPGQECQWYHDGTFVDEYSAAVLQDKHHALFDNATMLLARSNHAFDVIFELSFCYVLAALVREGTCKNLRFQPSSDVHEIAKRIANVYAIKDVHLEVELKIETKTDSDEIYDGLFRFVRMHNLDEQFSVISEVSSLRRHLEVIQVEYNDMNVVAVFAVSGAGVSILSILHSFSQANPVSFELNAFTKAATARDHTGLCQQAIHPSLSMQSQSPSLLQCTAVQNMRGKEEDEDAVFCAFCAPGLEYRNPDTGECEPCTTCPHGIAKACCDSENTMCLTPHTADGDGSKNRVIAAACGNGAIDIQYMEQCDWNSNTTNCCGMNCKLLPGYYTASCTTWCGDDIRAGQEECDNNLDPLCNPSTCKCFKYPGVRFNADIELCENV